jgi:hypothetical protein
MTGDVLMPREYLMRVASDPNASDQRKAMLGLMLTRREPLHPRLPAPASYGEIIAAVMLTEGKLKAAELGLPFAPSHPALAQAMFAAAQQATNSPEHLNQGLRKFQEVVRWGGQFY